MLSSLVEKLGPPGIRDVLARWLPHANFQALRRVVYALYDGSREIFLERKDAFQRDNSDVPLQDSKDLMSILCTSAVVQPDAHY